MGCFILSGVRYLNGMWMSEIIVKILLKLLVKSESYKQPYGKYKRVELVKWKYKYKEIASPCIARFRVKQYEGQEMLFLF